MKKLQSKLRRCRSWIAHHKKPLLIGCGIFFGLNLIIQLCYPYNRLLPFTVIDNQSVGMWQQKDALFELGNKLNSQPIQLYANNSSTMVASIKPADLGISIDDTTVSKNPYSVWWRLVPTSLFWYGAVQSEPIATYKHDDTKARTFVVKRFGATCVVAPQNATIRANGESLQTIAAKDGGICKQQDVLTSVKNIQPHLAQPSRVKIAITITKPTISTEQADKLAKTISEKTAEHISLKVGETTVDIPRKELFTWLDFTNDTSTIVASLNGTRAGDYLAKNVQPKIAKPAGITTVETVDFTEVSRKNGAPGVTLDSTASLAQLRDVMVGASATATAVPSPVAPSVKYSRSYTKSSAGITALITHYDQDHPGTMGVSFREIGGRGLVVNYNEAKIFDTASTYKLFVAYGTLKKIEANEWKWTDTITDNKTIDQCFDLMIVNSDNSCAEALYKKISYQKTIDDVRALGLSHTSLSSGGQQTSASDLTLFLTKLETGEIDLTPASRAKLLDAMKRNVYRQGIPAGASGTTADKVGFLNGLLHDAAVVYSPQGTYVLTVMTDGGSWSAIADLTQKIEALR